MVLDNLIYFITNLSTNNYAVWKDSHGCFEVKIGQGLIHEYIEKTNTKLFISDFIKINKSIPAKFNNVISIGGFSAHNDAKIEAQRLNIDLTTIPIPLSNDSFGTNRCSCGRNENISSFKCKFPEKVIFDLDMLIDFGLNESISGVGEYIGLYYSIIDFYLKNYNSPDKALLNFILNNFFELLVLIENEEKTEILKKISILLVLKCLIMRYNINHEIGCGIDHSFARVFEDELNMIHGKAVFLGSIISSFLFPEWDKWGLNTKFLVKSGKQLKIISDYDISFICDIDLYTLVNKAIKIRSERRTMLDHLSKTEIGNKQKVFNKSYNGIH